MFFHPSEVLREYNILPKKSFGQNFIVHRPTLETIAKKVLIEKPATVLEIGPGPGSLSQFLVKEVENLVLIEKDETFEKILEEKIAPFGKVQIVRSDFLEVDLPALLLRLKPPILAVGNLPYNVSVAILQKLLDHRHLFHSFHLMFQKEVADRLTARPSTKSYGSLSVYVQMLADLKVQLPIPASAFFPRPKILSSFVKIVPLQKVRFETVQLDSLQTLLRFVFQERRKQLINNLLKMGTLNFERDQLERMLDEIGIDPKRRGETLSLEEFSKIEQMMHKK